MSQYICIHGHFYQPPRENPWLEHVERQDSAFPYHDWNERITAECYGPNYRSRILNDQGKIVELLNNYAWISFNVGPTLLSWMAERAPEVYAGILEADRESAQRFSGHGSAMAQVYNHMILPLANRRDQRTQVRWGIADFKHRFGRNPEGMWLAETAVDTASLETLAENGIRFTVLAPRQAKRVRESGKSVWTDVSGGRIDPTTPYVCHLPSGKSIVIFFYDGPISQALAFETLLENGEVFANRLCSAFRGDRQHDQLVHIATDGETYGHHRRHAEMALSFALRRISGSQGPRLTNYGEFLSLHPPTREVEIFENSSWSCAHGVERWRSDCGCCTGMNPDWRQHWREPLREALDWLRDQVAEVFEEHGKTYFRDPWKTRDRYIQVLLDREASTVTRFLAAQGGGRLTPEQRSTALQLLEMQRHSMLMYTSCGWFFDELSGIETVQVIQYAGRALQLAEQVTGQPLESGFLERLERAKSNLAEYGDGRQIFAKSVKPAMVDLRKVAAHYAVSSLFEPYPERARVYAHRVTRVESDVHTWGKRRLALGRIQVESELTREADTFSYAVLHLGDHNISGGVRVHRNLELYNETHAELSELFRRDNVPGMIRAVDRLYGGETYSLQFLFKDDLRRIVQILLEDAVRAASSLYRSFYREHGPMARFLAGLAIPPPRQFKVAIDMTLQQDLTDALTTEELDAARVDSLVKQIDAAGIQLDTVPLEFGLRRVIETLAMEWHDQPGDLDAVRRMQQAIRVLDILPFRVNLWSAQNTAYDVARLPEDESLSAEWRRDSLAVAAKLGVAVG